MTGRTTSWRASGSAASSVPALSPPGEVIGEVSASAAEQLGLPAGLPVVGGAGDGQAAGLGANATQPGQAYLNLGTAVVAGTVSTRYAWDRAFRTLTGAVPGTYAMETLLQGGTYTVNWFLERIATLDAPSLGLGLRDVDLLEAAAARLTPGAEGLLLVPYLASAQTPYWDPAARGVLFGLAGHHGKQHIYRALIEGIAFEQRLACEAMEPRLEQPIDVLLTTGGGSRSALWRQIVADVTGKSWSCAARPRPRASAPGSTRRRRSGWHGSLLRGCRRDDRGVGARHTPTTPRRRDTTSCSRSTARSIREPPRCTGRCSARSRSARRRRRLAAEEAAPRDVQRTQEPDELVEVAHEREVCPADDAAFGELLQRGAEDRDRRRAFERRVARGSRRRRRSSVRCRADSHPHVAPAGARDVHVADAGEPERVSGLSADQR